MKRRISVLGGGMSGMAAVFGLTETPGWDAQYEITVYQLGWRLGGKGASGRNAAREQRIEEHGLHVWGGFYENAFRVMRACYAELGRPPGAPLATWEDAFKPNALVSWMEDLNPWIAWNNGFPEYASTPGDGQPMPSLWEGILRVVEWVLQTYFENVPNASPGAGSSSASVPPWIVELAASAPVAQRTGGLSAEARSWLDGAATQPGLELLVAAYRIMAAAPPQATADTPRTHQALLWLLAGFQQHPLSKALLSSSSEGARRAGILIDIGLAEVLGIIKDGVLLKGFDVINDMDLAAWLSKHGASTASVESGVVRGAYDFIFAYRGGDPSTPLLEAGTGLRMIFRLVMWYKGAIFWKMQAGMGDTVFAPLYQVLKNRGVKFRFFQEVQSLTPTADGSSIASIQMAEQATLKVAEYDPLVTVQDLPCWPSEPLYDQLVEGQQLKAEGIDLESPWAPWPPVRTYTLEAGPDNDFDIVVLATSLAPLGDIAAQLIAQKPAWAAMTLNVETVQTQAFQLWLTADLASLGWQAGPTVLTGYGHPFETWADMSQVIPREVWPPGTGPKSIAYFCGALPDETPIPPFGDHGFPAKEDARVRDNVVAWISEFASGIWPASVCSGAFDWQLLDDPSGGSGSARFDSQYWRANIAPSERYVLSLPGTTTYKLSASGAGYDNLYLAGDWVRNGLNFGCIESATMGGLQASRAICGSPKVIVGEEDNV